MNGFEKMKLRTSISGNSIRNEKILDSRYALSQDNENDPSYCNTFFRWIAGEESHVGEQIHPRIYGRKASSDRIEQKIQTLYEEITNIGDLFFDEKDGSYWICTEIFNMNEISWNGKLIKCNYTLTFQNSTGTILSYPCITSDKTFSEDENTIITLGANKKSVLLPFDDNTKLLEVGNRMYVDKRDNPTPYQIIGDIDTTTYNYGDKGLIYFIMQQDTSNHPNDRPDLGICGYIEPNSSNTGNTVNVNIICSSSSFNNKIKLGVTYNFIASITDVDGNPVASVDPEFSMDTNYSGLLVLTDNNNGTCNIKVNSSASSLVSKQVVLTCIENVSGQSASTTLTIAALY